jgi:hypothetical protein
MRKAYNRPVENLEPRRLMAGEDVVFIRGADRSGGGVEPGSDSERNGQLSDINNTSTAADNRGWGQLAQLLRDRGYNVTQVTEIVEAGAPSTGVINGGQIDMAATLAGKEIAVFGSNNAVYSRAQRSAVETWIRNGGSALFISDYKFGSNWGDAPNSDTGFTSRFGWTVGQDQASGQVITLSRANGDFLVPNHPIFTDVNVIQAEGVSGFNVGGPGADQTNTQLARFTGAFRQNITTNTPSPTRPATAADSSLVVAEAGAGRIVGWWDRNTFLNQNGAGSNLDRNDNRRFAQNVFDWMARRTITSTGTVPAVIDKNGVIGNAVTFKWNTTMNGTWNGAPQIEKADIYIRRKKRDSQRIKASLWRVSQDASTTQTTTTIRFLAGAPTFGDWQVVITPGLVFSSTGQPNPAPDIILNFRLFPVGASTNGAGTIVSGFVSPSAESTTRKGVVGDVFSGEGSIL